jgi:hypothetical protein
MEWINIPLGPSSIPHQPWTGGMGLEQPSFRTLEAIIEKRRNQRIVHYDSSLNSKETNLALLRRCGSSQIFINTLR